MNNVILFLSEHVVVTFYLVAFIVSVLIAYLCCKGAINSKVNSETRFRLSNKEYKTFCRKDKNTENEILSFDVRLCKDDNQKNEAYFRTLNTGADILKQKGFRISDVRDV